MSKQQSATRPRLNEIDNFTIYFEWILSWWLRRRFFYLDDNQFIAGKFYSIEQPGVNIDIEIYDDLVDMSAPSTDKWSNIPTAEFKTSVTTDESKDTQWDLSKEEIAFICFCLKTLIASEQ